MPAGIRLLMIGIVSLYIIACSPNLPLLNYTPPAEIKTLRMLCKSKNIASPEMRAADSLAAMAAMSSKAGNIRDAYWMNQIAMSTYRLALTAYELQASEKKVKDLEASRTELEKTVVELEKTVVELEKTVADLEKTAADLEKSLTSTRARLGKYQDVIDELEKSKNQ
jgi:chromosome segregation ATPase